MQLDEATRHEVFGTLRDKLGQTAAVVLMSAIPPFDWAEVATKADLNALEERLEERLTKRIEMLEHKLTAAFERGIRRALVAQTFTVFGGVVGLYLLAVRFAPAA